MRFRTFVLLACLAGFLYAELSNCSAQQRQLSVSLKDGSKVVGTSDAEFELKTAFGRAIVPSKHVSSISFDKQWALKTSDGTILKGELSTAQFLLKTSEGDKTIKLSDVSKIAALQRGELKAEIITDGIAENGMTYHVRAPKDFDDKKTYPSIVILHGSNMNSKAYVNTIAQAWPDIGNRFILIGINGEQRTRNSKDDDPRFNYTYVSFVGRSKYKGSPGTDRESPVLVKEVIEEIRGFAKISKVFIGGHSQGGYLTYMIAMNYPDLVDGAFPIAGGMIMQAEPSAFLHEKLRAMQRKVPYAIVHAVNDNVVPVKLSEAADKSLRIAGFPMLNFFKPTSGAHMFAMLPVDEAIEWLEKIAADDPQVLLTLAKGYVQNEDYRAVPAILDRLKSLKLDQKSSTEADQISDEVAAVATLSSRKLLQAITENNNGDWVDNYLLFLDDFPTGKTAERVHQAYQALRAKHEKRAKRLYKSAVNMLKNDEKEDAHALFEEIVEKYYASSHYRYAKRMMVRRKAEKAGG